MKNLQVFRNTEFGELKVLVIDGKEYFPATDCARMLGYSNPHKAVIDHCRYLTKREVPHPQNSEKTININYIPEGDLYRLIVKSQLPAAERFEKWVFDEVLPTIRKHGIYATDKVIEEMISNPEYGIKLFTELKAERDRRKALEVENAKHRQIISELKPKASYYDLILQNKSLVPISKIAKDYGMSGRAFNKLLHELGIQYKMGNCWLLYQEYADQGYTQSKTHAIDAERKKRNAHILDTKRAIIHI